MAPYKSEIPDHSRNFGTASEVMGDESHKTSKVRRRVWNPEYFWMILFASCFLAFQLVQDHIRPGYGGENSLVWYMLGVAPNFFPAVGIPALFMVIMPYFTKMLQPGGKLVHRKHLAANMASLAGLLAWEFAQIFTSGGFFDWHDVLWTLLGALAFYGIWLIRDAGKINRTTEEPINKQRTTDH